MKLERESDGLLVYISLMFISIVVVSCIIYVVTSRKTRDMKIEYYLEIINQDSVRIYSIDRDKCYKVPIDSIKATLEVDNL